MASITPGPHHCLFFFNDLHGLAYGTLGPRPFFSSQKLYNMKVKLKVKLKKKKYNKNKITTQVKGVKQPIWRKSEKKK